MACFHRDKKKIIGWGLSRTKCLKAVFSLYGSDETPDEMSLLHKCNTDIVNIYLTHIFQAFHDKSMCLFKLNKKYFV